MVFLAAGFLLVFAYVCTYLVVCFPFALWARHIAREDALNGIEAYILGQTCGPVGVWLVMRANKQAAAKQYRQVLLVEHERTAPGPSFKESPEQMERRLKEQGPLHVTEMQAGLAFRMQHDVRPVVKHAGMDTVTLTDPARPQPTPKAESAPLEPPPPPATKAAGAWRPPPAGDPKFMHSDEKREDARVPETGDGNG